MQYTIILTDLEEVKVDFLQCIQSFSEIEHFFSQRLKYAGERGYANVQFSRKEITNKLELYRIILFRVSANYQLLVDCHRQLQLQVYILEEHLRKECESAMRAKFGQP